MVLPTTTGKTAKRPLVAGEATSAVRPEGGEERCLDDDALASTLSFSTWMCPRAGSLALRRHLGGRNPPPEGDAMAVWNATDLSDALEIGSDAVDVRALSKREHA